MADNGEQSNSGDAGNAPTNTEYIKLKVVGQVKISFYVFPTFFTLVSKSVLYRFC